VFFSALGIGLGLFLILAAAIAVEAHGHGRALSGLAFNVELTIEQVDTFAHAQHPKRPRLGNIGFGDAPAIVIHLQDKFMRPLCWLPL
jgi:hypothetical protein